MTAVSRSQVSLAVAQLMPRIIQGVHLDFFVKRGVTQTQFLVLIAIHAAGRCPMGTLARNMHVQMPTATGIVNRLVRAGYVRRTPDPEDRRQVLVHVTDKGRTFIHDFQGIIRHRWEEVLKALQPAELGAFYRVVTKLREHLERAT